MIETDFGWALAKMRDGYKVRRAGWGTRYLRMPEDHGAIYNAHEGDDGYGEVQDVLTEDLLAWDWELAE